MRYKSAEVDIGDGGGWIGSNTIIPLRRGAVDWEKAISVGGQYVDSIKAIEG